MSRGARDSGRAAVLAADSGRRIARGVPEQRARIQGTSGRGCPETVADRKYGRIYQVAVFAGVLGLAASAFSRARFSSHSAFFLARRSRLRRLVRGSCGLPIVGGCLAEVFGAVPTISPAKASGRALTTPARQVLVVARLWRAPERSVLPVRRARRSRALPHRSAPKTKPKPEIGGRVCPRST